MRYDDSQYVLTNDIQEILHSYYNKHQEMLSFEDAMKKALSQGKGFSNRGLVKNSNHYSFFAQKEFEALLLSYPVSLSTMSNYLTPTDINEQSIFSDAHDIFAYKYLSNLKDSPHIHDYRHRK